MPTPLHDTIHLSGKVVPTHVQLAEENDLRQFLDLDDPLSVDDE